MWQSADHSSCAPQTSQQSFLVRPQGRAQIQGRNAAAERREPLQEVRQELYHCCGSPLSLGKSHPCDSPKLQKKVTAKKKAKSPRQFLKCPKCQATFSSSQNLRLHLSRLNPCDNSEPKQHDPGNKTCPKCNTTFTSAQSLRLHLTRLIPCDAEQPSGAKMDWEICHKCHKKFASERSLNIHLNQRECDGKSSSSQSHRIKRRARRSISQDQTKLRRPRHHLMNTCRRLLLIGVKSQKRQLNPRKTSIKLRKRLWQFALHRQIVTTRATIAKKLPQIMAYLNGNGILKGEGGHVSTGRG